jgi:hypothetical protein
METVNHILNNAFTLSLLLVGIGSLVGLYVKSHSRDRCLKDFENYRVTLEKDNGKLVWGRLKVYNSGIELEYESAHQDEEGHVENSYVLYSNEFEQIGAFYRYHDELTEEEKSRRKRAIRKVYKPSIFSIASRKLRNFANTFKDAILQSFGLVIGTKTKGTSLGSKQKELTGISGQLLTVSGGNAFDPILERYLGQYVVTERMAGDQSEEVPGILKEYSPKFLELLNVKVDQSVETPVDMESKTEHPLVDLITAGEKMTILNKSSQPIYAISLKTGETEQRLDVYVDSGKSMEFTLPEMTDSGMKLIFNLPRKVDMVLPRQAAVVRHGGKKIRHRLETLLGLDGFMDQPGIKSLKRMFVIDGEDKGSKS